MTPEGFVKKAIMEWLSYQRECVVFPIAMGVIPGRTSPMRKGTPDILCCLRGRFVAIEVKSPRGIVSPEQVECLTMIDRAKGVAIIARSVDELIRELTAAGLGAGLFIPGRLPGL